MGVRRRGLWMLLLALSTDSSCVGFQHALRALVPRSAAPVPVDRMSAARRAASRSVLGLRGSGIIISAGGDDLDKELSRMQLMRKSADTGKPPPNWRSDELHRCAPKALLSQARSPVHRHSTVNACTHQGVGAAAARRAGHVHHASHARRFEPLPSCLPWSPLPCCGPSMAFADVDRV